MLRETLSNPETSIQDNTCSPVPHTYLLQPAVGPPVAVDHRLGLLLLGLGGALPGPGVRPLLQQVQQEPEALVLQLPLAILQWVYSDPC